MQNISVLTYILFFTATAFSVFMFLKAAKFNRELIIIIAVWLTVQSAVTLAGFYTDTSSMPPRLLFALGIPLIATIYLSFTTIGNRFLSPLDLRTITLLHVVRIPVEICLYQLYIAKTVPELITFGGSNWDILSGLTSPVVYYLVFIKKNFGSKLLLSWNICCLILLANVVVHAVLSAPYPFQQFAFDQPVRAVLYFPFVLLPAMIVPIVLLSHIVAFKQLLGTATDHSLIVKREMTNSPERQRI